MECFSSLLIQGEGGVSILGCHWAEWDSMAARMGISAAGCCVCQRPVSCSGPLQTHCHPSDTLSPILFWLTLTLPFSFAISLLARSLFPLSPTSLTHIWNFPAVVHDPGQSDGVLRSDASPRCGLHGREGQAGMGARAGGGKEERSQTHRDGKREIWIRCIKSC